MRSVAISQPVRYLLVVVAVVLALLVRLALSPYLGDREQFSTFYAVVAVVAWYGGYRPALVAVALGYILGDWFFVEPRYTLGVYTLDPEELAGLCTFVFSSGAIIFFSESMRRRREQARDEAELRRVTLASIGDAVIAADTQGRVTMLNAVAESITGWPSQEAMGQPIGRVFQIVDEKTGQTIEDPVTRVLRDRRVVGLTNTTSLVAKDGTRRPIDNSGAPILDDQGNLRGAVLVFRDVAQRRQAEEALRSSEEEFRSIFELAATGHAEADPATSRYLRVNQKLCAITGYAADELLGMTFSQLTHPEDRDRDRETFQRLLDERGREWSVEKRYLRKDGQAIWVQVTGSVLWDANNRPVRAIAVIQDITERKNAEERLRASQAALREADRRKDEFLAMLGHELRNPLGAVVSGIYLLRAGKDRPADWVLNSIQRQTRHLTRLLDDLLDVSRISRGKIELRWEVLSLDAIVEASVETVAEIIKEHGHHLTMSIAPGPLTVRGDRVRLEQILANLLTNAAKYTDDGGRICVTAAREGDRVLLRVNDNGSGIPQEKLSDIFELFGQLDNSLHRSRGGLGIGLTLVRKLVELHGGSIAATSEGLGKGSEFTVSLPAVDDVPAISTAPAAGPAVEAKPGLRILLAEDNVDAAAMLAELLHADGFEVHSVHDGLAAVEAARRLRPDMAILDLGLPGLDGYEVARRLRADPDSNGLMLIALSGYGQEQDRARSREVGFDRHLLKPADFETLRSLLAQRQPSPRPRPPRRDVDEAAASPSGHSASPAPSLPAEGPASETSCRVVLIDDSRMVAELTAEMLEQEGYAVEVAYDGETGLERVRTVRPDLVLCDLSLPGRLDGHDVARTLRAEHAFRRTCLIALTGYNDPEHQEAAFRSGFDAHLAKPLDLDALRQAWEDWKKGAVTK